MSEPIRKALATDAEACGAVLNAWIDATDWLPREIEPDALVEILRDGLPKREAYVIGDPVVGYLSMDPVENHIWGFYVLPGQGLGKALMDWVKVGRNYLRLNSHAANVRAHKFYAREGFVQVGEAWMGSDGIDEITMEWSR